MCDLRLRELWRHEGGDQRSDVDGDDGDDDAGQEDGGQFVDVLHADENQQGHQEETDGAVDTHVVQHRRPFAFGLLRLKYGCFRCDVHLEEGEEMIRRLDLPGISRLKQ